MHLCMYVSVCFPVQIGIGRRGEWRRGGGGDVGKREWGKEERKEVNELKEGWDGSRKEKQGQTQTD